MGEPRFGPGLGPIAAQADRHRRAKHALTKSCSSKVAKSEAYSRDPIGLFWPRPIDFESNRELASCAPGPNRKTCELTS